MRSLGVIIARGQIVMAGSAEERDICTVARSGNINPKHIIVGISMGVDAVAVKAGDHIMAVVLVPWGLHARTVTQRITPRASHRVEIGIAGIKGSVDIRHRISGAERRGIAVGSIRVMALETEVVLQVDDIRL